MLTKTFVGLALILSLFTVSKYMLWNCSAEESDNLKSPMELGSKSPNVQDMQEKRSAERVAEESVKEINSKDLISKIPIIGELGHPWGEIITINGSLYVTDDGKNKATYFRVTHVEKKKLANPVDIGIMRITPVVQPGKMELLDSETRELRGYEAGELLDYPPQVVMEVQKKPGIGYDYIKFGFKFIPTFHYLNASVGRGISKP